MDIHATCGMNGHPYHVVDLSPPPKHGHLLNLLATPVTLCKGWQSGTMLIPVLYEAAPTYKLTVQPNTNHRGLVAEQTMHADE